jgi:hypothetical protein
MPPPPDAPLTKQVKEVEKGRDEEPSSSKDKKVDDSKKSSKPKKESSGGKGGNGKNPSGSNHSYHEPAHFYGTTGGATLYSSAKEVPRDKKVNAQAGDFISVKDAKNGNLVIREIVELERTIMGILRASEGQKDQAKYEKDVIHVCRGYYLKNRYSKTPPVNQSKIVPSSGPKATAAKQAEKPKKESQTADQNKEDVPTCLNAKDTEYFLSLCPSKFGALLELELSLPTDFRDINVPAIRGVHKSVVADLLNRNAGKAPKFWKGVHAIVSTARVDEETIRQVVQVNHETEAGKPQIRVYPSHLLDGNRKSKLLENDLIARFLFERYDRMKGPLVKEMQTAYMLLWYELQDRKCLGSSETLKKHCKPTKDLDLTEALVSKAAAQLFVEAIPFWKSLLGKMSPQFPPTPEQIKLCTREKRTLLESQFEHVLRPISSDKSLKMGRGNAMVLILLAESGHDFAVLKNFVEFFNLNNILEELGEAVRQRNQNEEFLPSETSW